jgi:hypothetical protein
MSGGELWHGTPGGYTNHHCRDTCCRTAWAADARRRRANRKAQTTRVATITTKQDAMNDEAIRAMIRTEVARLCRDVTEGPLVDTRMSGYEALRDLMKEGERSGSDD